VSNANRIEREMKSARRAKPVGRVSTRLLRSEKPRVETRPTSRAAADGDIESNHIQQSVYEAQQLTLRVVPVLHASNAFVSF